MKLPETDEERWRGRRLFRTDLFGEAVEGDAFGAGDVALVGVVREWREDEQATFSDCIEQGIGGFEELTEAIVGKEDDVTFLLQEHIEDIFLVLGDIRRNHDGAISGGFDATVHIIAEGLVVACFGFVNEVMADMDRLAVFFGEDEDITNGIVHAAVDFDIVLDAEKARFEALGSEAHGVHLDIADHGLELVLSEERAEEGAFPFPALFRSDMRG